VTQCNMGTTAELERMVWINDILPLVPTPMETDDECECSG